jgi:hypothetical protein
VRSVPVVVIPVLGEDLTGVGLVHDQNMVEHLAPDGADHSLAVGIHPRCPGCAEQHVHFIGFEDGVEGVGVLAVAHDKARGPDATAQVADEVT